MSIFIFKNLIELYFIKNVWQGYEYNQRRY